MTDLSAEEIERLKRDVEKNTCERIIEMLECYTQNNLVKNVMQQCIANIKTQFNLGEK